MCVHANQDVLQCRKALEEANVLECPREAGNNHVIRSRRSGNSNAGNQALIPGWPQDVEQECTDKAKERDGD